MDAFDLFRVGLTVVMFTLLLVVAVRQWRARAMARGQADARRSRPERLSGPS